MSYLIADRDFYEPWSTVDPGTRYHPGPLPDDWTTRDSAPWTHCGPSGVALPDQGWKAHVSSSLANAQSVLSVVSMVCVELGVAFKYLTGRRFFLLMHDKHAARVQAGKFCTVYPSDEQAALQVLSRLEAELSGISGPFVLTDRRFNASECVSYRYGTFRGRTRLDADAIAIDTMIGPDGEEIDDERTPEFRLPPGISDPFRQLAPKRSPGPVALHGYTFERVIQHSNSGGAYLFRSEQGEQFFIKEAKAHNGYAADDADAKTRLYSEYLTLRAIHGREPGLCPRPVELFHQWEHSFLVTEVVPGMSLYRWMVVNHPALQTTADGAAFTDYYRRGLALLDQLAAQVARLHELGYAFIDLSPTNVLVDEADQLRLIDFEAAQPIGNIQRIMGTPGYLHPDARAVATQDAGELDRYGVAALALMLLLPVHEPAQRHAPVLNQLRADLSELATVPSRLWSWATSYFEPAVDSQLPPPEHIRSDVGGALRWLAERTADCLQEMAQPDHPDRIYPTIPLGLQTNTRALATGAAGVLFALRRAGRHCSPAVVRRLRDESLAAVETTTPGLLLGSAGIANVLAELGEVGAAETLLVGAAEHPMNRTAATLGTGAAGTVYGLLVHHRRTGEQRWLELALQLTEYIADGDGLQDQLSPTTRSGLAGGRTGVALTFYHLAEITGDSYFFDRGMRLLQDELAYAEQLPVDGLGFKTGTSDRRVFPYLYAGSAGYASVLSRFLARRPEAEFDSGASYRAGDALERCLRACTIRFAVLPGLFPGIAGMSAVLAGAGRRLGRPELVEAGITSARGLFRYAIPRDDGIGWLGQPGQRFSAELWSGSAGILLALQQLTGPDTVASASLEPAPYAPGPALAERR